jgi:hypothetical protein
MPEWMITVGGWAVQIATFGGAIIVIYLWFAKPLKEVKADVADIKQDTGDLLCDRLTQAHDYHVRKGYCPDADKARLCAMHARYRNLGRNHLADSYEEDLLALRDRPSGRTEATS